jgi:hypothetical protein
MKNCARYFICAISLLLAISLILDAFADDDHYRKRHRYRGGSQKIDDYNNDHDRDDYLKPVANLTYKETCGGCHFAYQPELLPSASWQKILNQLDDHFGEEVEAEPDTIKDIIDYLKANGAESSSAKISVQIMRSLKNRVPQGLLKSPVSSRNIVNWTPRFSSVNQSAPWQIARRVILPRRKEFMTMTLLKFPIDWRMAIGFSRTRTYPG